MCVCVISHDLKCSKELSGPKIEKKEIRLEDSIFNKIKSTYRNAGKMAKKKNDLVNIYVPLPRLLGWACTEQNGSLDAEMSAIPA